LKSRSTEADWRLFKQQHRMTPEQTEAVLVSTVRHVLTLTNEIQQEANRLRSRWRGEGDVVSMPGDQCENATAAVSATVKAPMQITTTTNKRSCTMAAR
jgi:hypothetical protein